MGPRRHRVDRGPALLPAGSNDRAAGWRGTLVTQHRSLLLSLTRRLATQHRSEHHGGGIEGKRDDVVGRNYLLQPGRDQAGGKGMAGGRELGLPENFTGRRRKRAGPPSRRGPIPSVFRGMVVIS